MIRRLNGKFFVGIPEATVFAFGPPPIPGLGTGSGFSFMLQDRSGGTPEYLAENLAKFLAEVKKRPEIGMANSVFRAAVPQIFADVDRDKVFKVGVPAHRRALHHGLLHGRQLRQRLQPLRARLQGLPAGRARVPQVGEGPGPVLRARAEGGHDPARHPRRDEAHLRARVHEPLQPLPRRRGHRRPGPRLQLGPGHEGARGGGGRGAAQGHGLPVVERLVPGEEGGGHRRHRLRLRHDHGVPHPRGPVRELVARR